MKVKIKKVHPDAKMPTYATEGSACFDLYALIDEDDRFIEKIVYPKVALKFRTGLSFEVPEGQAMFVFSRSGHGFKDNVRLANCVGVIDSDYRGELMVKLTGDDGSYMKVSHGDRIAQGVIMPVPKVKFEFVEELSETARGEGGFGSTGIN